MKRSFLALFVGLLAAVMVACGAPTEPAVERPLLTDDDIVNASTVFGTEVELRIQDTASLTAPAVSSRTSIASADVAALGAAALGSQAFDTELDAVSHYAFAYTFPGSRGRTNYRIRVKKTFGGTSDVFANAYLLYDGLLAVDSVAVTADGEFTAFIAEGVNGSAEVFLFDTTGNRTGLAGVAIQITDTPYDEADVDMSLDGTTIVWQGIADTTGAPSPVIAQFDPAGPSLSSILLDFGGLPIVETSVSGDGSVAIFGAVFGPGSVLIATIPTDLSDDATGIYGGDVSDPSISAASNTVMFAETFGGVPFVSLITADGSAFLADLIAGVDVDHPKLTADGAYFAFGAGGDVFARNVNIVDPDAALESDVSVVGGWSEYQANWAKPAFGMSYFGSTLGADEFTRPDDGSGLTDEQRTSPYHAYPFFAPVSDFYELASAQDYDGYIALYQDSFNPFRPNRNYLAGNDDFDGSYDPDSEPAGRSRLVAELEGGRRYVLVTTACGDPDAGCGPDAGLFSNSITRGATPPLPPDELPAPNPAGFDITLRFFGDPITDEQAGAFTGAAARWSAIITGDLTDLPGFSLPQDFSFPGAPPVEGTLDDVLIDVNFTNIDGPSGILGRAGPRLIRSGTPDDPLTVYGIMEFDISEFGPGGFFDDPQAYQDVIVHEMGHVIGIGTLWTLTGNTVGVLGNPPTVPPGLPNPDYDPRFIGAGATAEYQTLLAAKGYANEDDVPIANTGGPGNYNGHWREIAFGDELMTPYAAGVELLSVMTAASLGDLGYVVDLTSSAIDFDYELPDPRIPGVFRQTAPAEVEYEEGVDFVGASDSPKVAVGAAVTNVDLNLGDIDVSTSGCEASDFAGFPAGQIALVRRGTCAFADKVNNAAAAGAVGVIIMNQGNTPDRTGLLDPVLGDVTIPVVFTTFDLGLDLANTAGLEVFIDTGAGAELRAIDASFEDILQAIGSMTPDGTIRLFPGVDGTQLAPYQAD